jgi:nitrite reductase/ring-hydroxylating ferredoxin subunit
MDPGIHPVQPTDPGDGFGYSYPISLMGSGIHRVGRRARALWIRGSIARVFACDNRCPHQGYALVRGDVKDGVLTCAWHNWNFELGSGTCRYGGESTLDAITTLRGIPKPESDLVRPMPS